MSKCYPLELLSKRQDCAKRRAGYYTFNYWQSQGRMVCVGEKAKEFNSHGTALFHKDQTEEFDFYPESDWDDTWPFAND